MAAFGGTSEPGDPGQNKAEAHAASEAGPPAAGLGLQLDAQRLVFEFAEAAVIVDISSRQIRAANPRCEPTLGWSPADLAASPLGQLLAGERCQDAEPIEPETLLAHPGLYEAVPMLRADGSVFVASVQVLATTSPEGPMALLFIRDTSERRKLERELIEKHLAIKEAFRQTETANQQLAVANRDLAHANEEIRATQRCLIQLDRMATVGRFAAGVAHEVVNPVAFILVNLRHLQELSVHLLPALRDYLSSPGPCAADREQLARVVEELQPSLEESLQGAQRVSSIVRQLHSFSRRSDEHAEQADLREILDSSITMVKHQVTLRARMERHYYEIPRVACVPGQLSQVFVNLLVNAIQAVPDGNPEQNFVRVRTRPAGEEVIVEVQDSGCGIAPEHLDQVLEPFFTTKPAGKGSGLGLAISASIVEQHGGRIEIESQRGQGTTMRVVLPVKGAIEVLRRSEPTAAAPPRSLRLLLVDDETYLLRALKRGLGQNHEVMLATSGQEALDLLLRGEEVDFILTDLTMPDMNGIHLFQRILAARPELRGHIGFMTGGIFEESQRTFLADCGAPVLNKPVETRDVIEVLTRVVEGR